MGTEAERLERERGVTDDLPTLLVTVRRAPAGYLEGALDNRVSSAEVARLILTNRAAGAMIVARIGRNRSWMRDRQTRAAFVRHPRAPEVLARRLLLQLDWTALADVASDTRLSPLRRTSAERILSTRLAELSVGERVTLARRPSRGIVEALRTDREDSVLRSLARNPFVTASDIVRVAARPDIPSPFLSWLASSPWIERRDVTMAVARQPRTPAADALRLLRSCSVEELTRVCGDTSAPRLVRVAAARRLRTSPETVG